MNLFTKQKKTLDLKKKKYASQTEKMKGGINQEFQINTYTTIYKLDHQQRPTAQHSNLYSLFCNNLYGKNLKMIGYVR